jgi:hypothetical protein
MDKSTTPKNTHSKVLGNYSNIRAKLRSRSPIRSISSIIFMTSLPLILLFVSVLLIRTQNFVLLNIGLFLLAMAIERFTAFIQNAYCHETSRPDILYLRSFETDQREVKMPSISEIRANSAKREASIEYACEFAVSPDCDLVGLMRPPFYDYERVATIFRVRKPENAWLLETRDDSEWKDALNELFNVCYAAIIECSTLTPGVHWEIEQAARKFGPEKLLLVAESKDEETLNKVAEIIYNVSSQGFEDKDNKSCNSILRYTGASTGFILNVRNKIRSIAPLENEIRKRNIRTYKIRRALFYPAWLCKLLKFYAIGSIIYFICKTLFVSIFG